MTTTVRSAAGAVVAEYYRYWGKASPQDEGFSPYHLLAYHALDVAAVGLLFAKQQAELTRTVAALVDIEPAAFPRVLAYMLALHDLGKFSESFQHLRPDIALELRGATRARPYLVRHDSLGAKLAKALGDQADHAQQLYERHWAYAVTGHHGTPPRLDDRPIGRYFADADIAAARQYREAVADLFAIDVRPRGDAESAIRGVRRGSWWIAGLAVLSDWIGSNQRFFPYRNDVMPLRQYWMEEALPRAGRALAATGLAPVPTARHVDFAGLYPFIAAPTPLQAMAAEMPLEPGPALYCIEDVTGSGKTEAALYLVHRLMAAGLADGFYVALPTTATANAMYARLGDAYEKLFAGPASLVLAHGTAGRNRAFRETVVDSGPVDAAYGAQDETASSRCNSWFADNHKAALLANAGVGTIDQALLAVLMSRHQSLRLLGLARKVLVVDEVHACDDYMNGVLQNLLRFHAAAGGSAILLSATLPQAVRERLIQAYCESARVASLEYPLITTAGMSRVTEHASGTRPELIRDVSFRLVHSPTDVLGRIRQAVAAGQCVCWIRNTVADAIEAQRLVPGALLFHARFTAGDRAGIESAVLRKFGKASTAADRSGQVVIATQVVEQSLDLDFDLLISDLAPMDLLIQRAGRCCRHSRDRAGNPSARDERGAPEVLVLAPVPVESPDANWYRSLFPRAHWVYPDVARLWLTARKIASEPVLRVPEGLRPWIEHVYGGPVPDGLRGVAIDQSNRGRARQARAQANSVALDSGYAVTDGQWWDEDSTPTRLGEPTSRIVLFREEAPWNGGLADSEVRIRAAMVAEPAPGRSRLMGSAIPVHLTESGGSWRGEAIDSARRPVVVTYSSLRGLEVEAQ